MINKPLPKRNVKELLSRDKIGLLLRVYATEERLIPERIEMVKKLISRAMLIRVAGLRVISRVDVVVWNNPLYKDRADCGKTYDAMKDVFAHWGVTTEVHHLTSGDLFCSALSFGVMQQAVHGCDYTVIASAEALSYMTDETMENVVKAAADGARAVGVAISELTPSVMRGRLANTFCMWHNVSLAQVGMFDKRAEMMQEPEHGEWAHGWEPTKGPVKYPKSGVEEILPLCRMWREFGECTASVLPAGEGVQHYQMPDPATNRVEWDRQQAKWLTKEARQISLAESAGFKISAVEGAVMEQYRTF